MGRGLALLGSLLGSVTGMLPGLHANVIAVVLAKYDVASLLLATAVAHTMTDAIPSTFLGAASSETALSVLPAHKLLLKGRGYEAVVTQTRAGLLAVILVMMLTPLLAMFLPPMLRVIAPYTWYGLIAAIAAYLTLHYKSSPLFFLSGILGVLALRNTSPLFPLLTGLFGVPTLLSSYDTIIPRQSTTIFAPTQWLSIVIGVVGGIVMNVLPAMSTSHTAALLGSHNHLTLVSSINAADQALTPVMLAVLNKARSGSAKAIQHMAVIGPEHLGFLAGVTLLAAGIGAIVTISMGKLAQFVLPKIPYKLLYTFLLVLFSILSIVLHGWHGLIVLVTASAIGMLGMHMGSARSAAMGCLLLPTIITLAP